ncbi:MAG: 2-oxoglutarate dehydrogenase E1 component [Chitinophagaceae bacterium]|nr:MAG: 2-oxoglutarate dehydrogenase E1 component [Chitinophagaceae bacterium]
MDNFSFISNAHPSYLESMYRDYKKDPNTIDQEWRLFFEGFDFALKNYDTKSNGQVSLDEVKVWSLIQAYRKKGHLLSKTNPIRERKDRNAELDIKYFGLDEKDLDKEFVIGKKLGLQNPTLRNIVDHLQKAYCRSIGIEFTHINDEAIQDYFIEKMENKYFSIQFSLEKKKRIFQKLNETVAFEKFLHTKYIGQKRFSLEGGETTIPALDAIINHSADLGTEEVVIGMAHRGRLNILANLLGKTYGHIFNEFEGNVMPDLTMGDGDVKYHLGFSSEIETPSGKTVNLKLAPNPSHLEAVNPVVIGYCRAKMDLLYNYDTNKALPILIHGDAALPGQGVVYEVAQMSQLKGYKVGGTIHFVINNQIGFTTDFDDARSSVYSTSVANTIDAPTLHVNGDDVEAVIFAVEMAAEFRNKFKRDIFIDMVCYRKHGHNESDDPKFTQPSLYNIIEKHNNPREIYSKKLIDSGSMQAELANEMNEDFWKMLQERLDMVKQKPLPYHYQEPEKAWKTLRKSKPLDFEKSPSTSIDKRVYDLIFNKIFETPKDFTPLRKIKRLNDQKKKLLENNQLDWALAEWLAYGSLLLEGHHVRMSGQDVKRGTFSHRNAILYDEKSSEEFNRLNDLSKGQGKFRIYNSLLSEFGVLGFEYGYSLASPEGLTIWEAQFGDFSNGAQTIIDQFIVSAESKWQRMSGLVMLLPHGYEGQGPEHSSARLERFLQLSAEFNICVLNCTTPANFFHAIRRQLSWPFRKPLVVMSPKSLLRHPECISPVEDFLEGSFKEIYDDAAASKKPASVKRVLLCSGKIYYELKKKKAETKRNDIAVVRIEQLYPLPFKQLDAIVKKYKNAEFFWIQEEPANMGGWVYLLSCYNTVQLKLIARKSSASPATGYAKIHQEEQDDILNKAFN